MIMAVALLVLGPTKLPELARSLGKTLREFRKATEDFKSTIDDELHKPDPPKGELAAAVQEAGPAKESADHAQRTAESESVAEPVNEELVVRPPAEPSVARGGPGAGSSGPAEEAPAPEATPATTESR